MIINGIFSINDNSEIEFDLLYDCDGDEESCREEVASFLEKISPASPHLIKDYLHDIANKNPEMYKHLQNIVVNRKQPLVRPSEVLRILVPQE